jgi:uncharacterized iron-regulated membrane protein
VCGLGRSYGWASELCIRVALCGYIVQDWLGSARFHGRSSLILLIGWSAMDDIGAAASGGMRKLQNLADYMSLSQQAHPNATIRAIAVSDAPAGTKLAAAVYKTLGGEAAEFIAVTGWKLLPLQTIGTWVQDAMNIHRECLSDKMKFVLEDLVEWCQ